MTEHLRTAIAVIRAVTDAKIAIRLTVLDPHCDTIVADAIEKFAQPDVSVDLWPQRTTGRHYYGTLCFKIFAANDEGDEWELGDGGFVGWSQQLVPSRKERMLISGLGLDRLAMLRSDNAQ